MNSPNHSRSQAQQDCRGPVPFGLGGRRAFLQTGLAGFATLSLPNILKIQAARAAAAKAEGTQAEKKAVIMVWQPGGLSHLTRAT